MCLWWFWRDSLGRILSDLASLLFHIRSCIYAVHFVPHTLHLWFDLTPSPLEEGLPPFLDAQLCATFARCILVLSHCIFALLWMWLLLLSRNMYILCVVLHCDLVETILALLLFLGDKISSVFFRRTHSCSLFLSSSWQHEGCHMSCIWRCLLGDHLHGFVRRWVTSSLRKSGRGSPQKDLVV